MNINDVFVKPEEVDDQSYQMLLKSLLKNNQEGFDYLEFMASIYKLRELDMDETTAMKSAYTTASTFGVTKQLLEQSALKYIQNIKTEYQGFRSALERQVQSKIIEPKDQINAWEKELGDIDVQIEKLQKKKILIQQRTEEINKEIVEEQGKLAHKEVLFKKSFDVLINKIENDIQKINQAL